MGNETNTPIEISDNNIITQPNSQTILDELPKHSLDKQNSQPVVLAKPLKIDFFYIKPKTLLSQIFPTSQQQLGKQSITKLEQVPYALAQNYTEFVQKIAVNWNKFIKIKQKSYLQDYIFIKQIGNGACGTVSKVRMKYGGLCRAAKTIKLSIAYQQKNGQNKLRTQLSIPLKLDHPNIIKIYQVYHWKQKIVMITQLCQGGDLYRLVRQSGNLSQSMILQLIKQVLSGILYLHTNKIMHRDIKLENILYDDKNKLLKIIDFGFATEFQKAKKLNKVIGTSYYMAPQVINGSYDEKCDIWSIGVMLYILLCGSPPFTGKTQKQIFYNILHQPLEFKGVVWEKRSKSCIKLVSRMLKKDPSMRLSAAQCLSSQWISKVHQQQQSQENGIQVIKNLQNFHFKNKLKAVVYTFIASQLYSNKDKEILLKVFRSIDKDNDGVIGKEELLDVYNQYSKMDLSPNDIKKIIAMVDTNQSGQIDFTEFLVAASNQHQLLQTERLENAFFYLDTDRSGYITMDQVKSFLDGTDQTSQQIRKIFQEVDTNGDGTISKAQFMFLLLKKK